MKSFFPRGRALGTYSQVSTAFGCFYIMAASIAFESDIELSAKLFVLDETISL